MGRAKRIWYLSPMRAAKVQASLRIRAVSPEPSLLAHTSSESRGTFRQKARSLAPLNGWACAVKICHDGMLEDTNSLGGAQMEAEASIFLPVSSGWRGTRRINTDEQMVKVFYLNRFTRWAYSIARFRRPSSSSSIVVHTFEQRYLQDQSANFSQILSVASLGRGKCCIRFWGRSDQNCGYHGNRNLPLTYNGEKNGVNAFSQSPLIGSLSNMQLAGTVKNLGWFRI